MIDFTGLAALHERHGHEISGAMAEAACTGQLIDGPHVRELEAFCAEFLGKRYAAAVGSGTDALTIALRAINCGPGDEVIVTSYSFIASASPILLTGATPVYVPISSETLHPTAESITAACTSATKAIIAVHLFGGCMPGIEQLRDFADARGITLIEDTAQAFGSRYHGSPAGTFGTISTFSFDPLKVFGGVTTGGLLATDDYDLYRMAVEIRGHGYDAATAEFRVLGLNSRMATVNAAVLLTLSPHQQRWRDQREAIAQRYSEALADKPVQLLRQQSAATSNFHKYVIRHSQRGALKKHFAENGIGVKVHYRRALPDHPALAGHGRVAGTLENARAAALQSLSLPVHPFMTEPEINRTVAAIQSFRWL